MMGVVRCQNAGSLSRGLRGDGAFYCREHVYGGSFRGVGSLMPDYVRDLIKRPKEDEA